jgi:uncharacterized tellurite resistance protein B-like protein
LKDLCFIAKADGSVSDGERKIIERIADRLEVSLDIISENTTS